MQQVHHPDRGDQRNRGPSVTDGFKHDFASQITNGDGGDHSDGRRQNEMNSENVVEKQGDERRDRQILGMSDVQESLNATCQ